MKKKRGGKRAGAGRKPKYNEPTKVIGFRVPISKTSEIKKVVNNIIQSFKQTI